MQAQSFFHLILKLLQDKYIMIDNSKQKSNEKSKSNQPLLKIPEQRILIFNDRIQIHLKQNKINSLNSLQTNPTLTQISSTITQIYFSQTDIVFKLADKQKKFLLSKISNYQKPFFEIKVQNNQHRNILHHILRKKWCEAGFEDQYNLLEQIGKGAMAKVYLVERKQDKKKFAAKIIFLKTECQKAYDTFINQTKILRVLNNPHVVNLEGVYISQKKQLIQVLQYLNGGTLYQALKQKRLNSTWEKFKAVKDITTGLQHLRQKRIVHRDLKLENIMIRKLQNGSKQYVITDFGLSNWMGQRRILFQKCGTPGYLAPQILHQKRGVCLLTHATDIFSLGVLFHFIYMLESLFPFDGCPKKLIQLNKKAKFSLKDAKKYLNQKQFILLERTLQIDPEKRASTKQLLEKYIPPLEEYILKNQEIYRKRKQRQNQLFQVKNPKQKQMKFNLNEQRPPSYKKKQMTVVEINKNRSRTQVSQEKTQSSRISINSARKVLAKVVTKIQTSFSLPKKQQIKTKNKLTLREEMKSYLD